MGYLTPTEQNFEINGINYHIKLIPKKIRDSDKISPSLFRAFGMYIEGIDHYVKVEGKVECIAKNLGTLTLKNPKRNIGIFREIIKEDLETSYCSLEIQLKEHPRKKIILNRSYSDFEEGRSKKILIQGRGRNKTETILN